MTDADAALAQAARGLVGKPFRLHGRDPETGLDCVGLVAAALAAIGRHPAMPTGYALRNLSIAQWLPMAERGGLAPTTRPVMAGQVLLIALPHSQHHLAITADAHSVVHAHAGLKRVVLQPRDPAWLLAARWRLAAPTES